MGGGIPPEGYFQFNMWLFKYKYPKLCILVTTGNIIVIYNVISIGISSREMSVFHSAGVAVG